MKPALKIPTILLEGDEPTPTPASGPGQKFALREPARKDFAVAEALPAGYGAGRLLLVARDPYGLYANWDPDAEQQRWLEPHADLVLSMRVYLQSAGAQPVQELRLGQGKRHSFLGVKQPGEAYYAEIGYYQPDGQWQSLAKSEVVTTPPAAPVEPTQPQFTRVQIEQPGLTPAQPMTRTQVAPPAPPQSSPTEPVPAQLPPRPVQTTVVEPSRRVTPPAPRPPQPAMPPHDIDLPAPEASAQAAGPAASIGEWTAVHDQALHRAGAWESAVDRQPAGATIHEIHDLAGLVSEIGLSSLEAAGLELLPAGVEASITSPAGAAPELQRGFWFKVDAELVIYGATEPSAQVTVEGRPIDLRADGSFSFRLTLPEGVHEVSLTAESGRGEVRHAKLVFVRSTQLSGG